MGWRGDGGLRGFGKMIRGKMISEVGREPDREGRGGVDVFGETGGPQR